MRKLFAVLLAVIFSATAVPAQTPPDHVIGVTAIGTMFAQAATAPDVSAPAPTPPPGQFVTVRDGSTTISGGSLLGQLATWIALLIGAPVAGAVLVWVRYGLKKLGVEMTDSDRARLTEFVEHGIALAADRVNADLKGKLPIEVKGAVQAAALEYVQDHGADTLKKLGFDPNDPKSIEAIQARIAKTLDDKATPTALLAATPA